MPGAGSAAVSSTSRWRSSARTPSKRRRASATLAVLAIARFEDRTGTRPATLNDLVAAGILTAVPADPYADRPLRYDAIRQLLWSVGADGINSTGPDASASGVQPDDPTWGIVREP